MLYIFCFTKNHYLIRWILRIHLLYFYIFWIKIDTKQYSYYYYPSRFYTNQRTVNSTEETVPEALTSIYISPKQLQLQ